MTDRPLDAGDITALLAEVADELADEPRRRIVVVGGALLALHGLREATRDVDSTTAVDDDLRAAVARVAARHGLAPAWLNDRARPFRPVTFDEAECEVLWEHCTFETPAVAAEAFHLGYPHLEHDEHLADHIRRLI